MIYVHVKGEVVVYKSIWNNLGSVIVTVLT